MTRVSQWIENHGLDHQTLWWGLAWTACNIGLIVLIMAFASAA